LTQNKFIEKHEEGNENKYSITETALKTYFEDDSE
jgi:hypothetical protein